jgi:predicted cupin superfamily sugar epimerase
MTMTADDVIRLLNLQPHPVEGGYFRETYRASTTIAAHGGARNVSTAIYYLLKPGHVSELHVLPTDEVFHFYLGAPVKMLQLWPDGTGREVVLGSNILAGEVPQLVVPAGVWQGTGLVGDFGFALLGCTVAPGFDYVDYQSASRAELIAKWPAFAEEIARLTPRR